MSLDDNLRALERAPVLSDIGREALRLLAFSAEQVRLARGDILFTTGDDAESAYVLVSGRIELRTGREQRIVGPGTLIGEIALVVPTTRPCDAVAAEAAHLLAVPRATFRRMLEEYPNIAAQLRNRLLERMRAEYTDLNRISENLDRLSGA